MQPRLSRRLDDSRHLDLLAQLAHGLRQHDHMREGRLFRIQIDEAPVGTREVIDTAWPDVQRDRTEVHQVDERLDVVRDEVLDVALRILAPDRNRLNPVGNEPGRVFLIERLAVDAVGIAGQYDGTFLQIRQQPGRHRTVVLDQVALGVSLLWPEDLVEVRELYFPWERGAGRCTWRHCIILVPSAVSLPTTSS